jgi:fumarylacetoacetase
MPVIPGRVEDTNPESRSDYLGIPGTRLAAHAGPTVNRTEILPHPNDPTLRSFVPVDAASDFPIQNLPYGVFSTAALPTPRIGVAIGDYVLDLWELEQACRLDVGDLGVFASPTLNPFMALGSKVWSRVRARISELLRDDYGELRDNQFLRARTLVPMGEAKLHLPFTVAGYTDFYSSKEHATNVGVMFRGKDNALQPNWLHMPIGYNGRASTVVVSGTKVRRPCGQLKPPNAELPSFGPCKRLDFELEMGAVVGQSSPMGEMLTEAQAEEMIFGFVLLNDWSARDIQQWEYVPLGPFQGKAFATSISPWVVTREALEPFRQHGPRQDPAPLPYLRQTQPNNYDLELEVGLRAALMNKAARICHTNFKYMYWSSVQQLVHHASSGCAMNVGDLLGSGTISGPEKAQRGSLLEISWNGAEPIELASGIVRTFLEDGDSLVMRGWCQGVGYRVGFGEVEGTILPAA